MLSVVGLTQGKGLKMRERRYGGAEDLLRLQRFTAEQIAINPIGWLQPGDIPHRLYNGHRENDPADLLRFWEDDTGQIIGWAFAYPDDSFDIQSHDPKVIEAALAWIETTLTAETIETDLFNGDDPRQPLLLQHGFEEATDEPPYFYTVRSLLHPIPPPSLPAGFTIRTVTGIEDAEKLAAVHAGAFDSEWTAAAYAQVMQSPGYDPSREFVVVSPDGRFAGFALTWHDTLNKNGYFEPVGTHQDFQKLGLARALLFHAMHTMKSIGLVNAIVMHEPPEENPASAALYQRVGFETRYTTHLYQKTRAHHSGTVDHAK
jgi:mycothiol synthase